MNRISIMTISMIGQALYMYRMDQDKENLEEYFEEMMDLVRDAGYKAVDITSHEVRTLGVEYINKQLEDRGLAVSSYIHFDFFASQDEGFEERVMNGKNAVDIAMGLNTDVLMLVPMAHDGVEQETSVQLRQNMVKHWKPIAAYAVQYGIHPVVEDTPDLRLDFCKAKDVLEVMDAVPGLELVYDSGNMVLDGEDPVKYAGQFAGRIGFVHLKDVRVLEGAPKGKGECMRDGTLTQTVPTGTGMIDLKGVVSRLLQDGYTGGMTVEFAKNPERSYLDSLRCSREYVEKLLTKNEEGKK